MALFMVWKTVACICTRAAGELFRVGELFEACGAYNSRRPTTTPATPMTMPPPIATLMLVVTMTNAFTWAGSSSPGSAQPSPRLYADAVTDDTAADGRPPCAPGASIGTGGAPESSEDRGFINRGTIGDILVDSWLPAELRKSEHISARARGGGGYP